MADEHLCTAPACWVRGHHLDGCEDNDRCRGCKPALAEYGEAFCTTCTGRLRTWLVEIPELFADVVNPPPATNTATRDLGAVDPVTVRFPAGTVPGASRNPRVSGSPEETLAARFAEAGAGSVHVRNDRGQAQDQVGDLPPAVHLDSWCRDWQHSRNMGETLPPPTVANLCTWLLDRLPWALQRHGAMAEFYGEIKDMHTRLWREAGRSEARPEPCWGVPCRRCDLLTLYRTTDGSGDVECHNPDCKTLLRAHEYEAWTRLVAAATERASRQVSA
jgi:hypothetical protein